MPKKTKFGFGSSSNVEQAVNSGKINARDVVFLDENTDCPKVGWVTLDGKVVVSKPDLSEVNAELATKANAKEVEAKIAEKANTSDVAALETELATKVNEDEVDAKIDKMATDFVATAKAYTDGKIEAAVNEHLVKKYEVTSLPEGSLVNYREDEIRIMCKSDAVFSKQSVGTGGDPNCYYMTFKTYVFNDNVVGYREHLGNQSDSETLTDLKTDEYGRRYQPTWLALAKYDDATGTWNYYGKNSSGEKFIGWDYRIDWYDANGVIVASDSIRINLANEDCYFTSEPYYVGSMKKEIDTIIEEKISEVEASYEIVEF